MFFYILHTYLLCTVLCAALLASHWEHNKQDPKKSPFCRILSGRRNKIKSKIIGTKLGTEFVWDISLILGVALPPQFLHELLTAVCTILFTFMVTHHHKKHLELIFYFHFNFYWNTHFN
jgi:hypothetical protein